MYTVMQAVATGTWETRSVIEQTESELASGTPVLLQVRFPSRWFGFEAAASALNLSMQTAGITPWPGRQYVEAMENEPVWVIRWTRNPVWLTFIWSLLRSLLLPLIGITLLAYVTWTFFVRVIANAVDSISSYLPYALIGVTVLGIISIARLPPGR